MTFLAFKKQEQICNICIVSELSLYVPVTDVTDKDKEHLHGFKDLLLLQYNECIVQTFFTEGTNTHSKNILDDIIFSERKTHFFYCKQQRSDLLTISR